MAFSNIGLQEPSTITKSVSAVSITRNSSTEYQEILCIGDANSSLGLAAVTASAPPSTTWGLAVRLAGGPSSAADVAINVSSLAGTATVQQASTTWAVQLSNYVAPSTTVSVAHMVGNSSAADYMPVRIVDSSGTGYLAPGLEYTDGSTTSTLAAPGLAYSNGSNTTMRLVGTSQPLPVQLRSGINAFASTSAVINSSASSAVYSLISSATTKNCVYAYSITSTAVTPLEVKFCSSKSTGTWTVGIGSGSSGITGANLAVPHPSRIFATAAGEALNVILTSTGVNVRISVASFTE